MPKLAIIGIFGVILSVAIIELQEVGFISSTVAKFVVVPIILVGALFVLAASLKSLIGLFNKNHRD